MSNIANPTDEKSVSYWFRSRRDRTLRSFLLAAKPNNKRECRIADLGGGAAYWERVGTDWLAKNGFFVDCYNLELSELSRDAQSHHTIRLLQGDACNMREHKDNSYDIVHSNSVIEHVGDWNNMTSFAKEVRRLAPAYYIQTPYFWFPIDPHFFRVPMIHWLPLSLQAKAHSRFRAGWGAKATNLDEAMFLASSSSMLDRRQLRWLFPDGVHIFERVFGLPKSMIATRLFRL